MINLTRLLCLLLLVHTATAQVASGTLGEDPVFNSVLSRRIVYPAKAEQLGVYAKIYVGFNINPKGHIQDILILNPVKVGYGLEEEVIKKLKRLPPLNPKHAGNYALPVIFALTDYTDKGVIVGPSGNLSNTYLRGRLLLNSLTIVGSKTLVQKGNELAPYSRGAIEPVDPR